MPEMDPAVLQRLNTVHQQSVSRIQIAAEAAAMSLWFTLGPDFDLESDTDMAQWAALFYGVTKPATDAVASATQQYMSATNAYVGISTLMPAPSGDWFRDDFDGWALSPFAFARDLTENPVAGTGPHVKKLVSAATRQSEIEAFNEIVNSIEWEVTVEYEELRPPDIQVAATVDEIPLLASEARAQGYRTTQRYSSAKRWKRVTQAGSCGWCEVIASNIYSDKARNDKPTGAYHTFCRCSWRMMTPAEAKAWEPPLAEGGWSDVIDRRADVPQSAQTGSPTT